MITYLPAIYSELKCVHSTYSTELDAFDTLRSSGEAAQRTEKMTLDYTISNIPMHACIATIQKTDENKMHTAWERERVRQRRLILVFPLPWQAWPYIKYLRESILTS